MLNVSSGFLQAIRNKAPQNIRLEFMGGSVIEGADIAITSGGLTITEVLNSATDVEFGRAVMSELSVVLINADGRFTDFNFNRDFVAKVGAKVGNAFEYVNLGVFKGEHPDKVRGKLIEFTAHDRMSLFDKPAENFVLGLTFPSTLGNIYTKLCNFCGVGYTSSEFTNSGKTFAANPLETDITCREILAYIAESAGSYARMSRDGAVELVWFANTSYTVARTDRFEMTESEFLTPPIDRLEVYNSYGDQLNTAGIGDIVYGISDNPFLYIENDTQLDGLQPYVDAIYNKIASLPAYPPSSFRAEFNPAVQCGDIISVVNDYGETIRFPVFVQTITWSGFGKTTYENTGGVIRQNAPFTQRELEQLKKKSVKTKGLWTYIDSYMNSEEGVASIKQAVGGNFVTEDQITGFITETELNSGVEAYISGEEGIAKITDSLSGVFVTTGEYNKSVHITATSQVFVKASGASSYSPSSITLTATTKGTGLSFQWYKNDDPVPGATEKTLTITSDSFSGSSATYKFVATDVQGNTFTDIVSIAKLEDGATGPQGPTGATGPQGTPGKNGTTYYTWIKYADTPTSGMDDNPDGKTYIGIAVNKTTPTESSNYGDYTWSLIKGANGVPGTPGKNGVTYYTWIRYADDVYGSGISNNPDGKKYIGFAYNKTTATESENPNDYTWSLIKGADGAPGAPGSDGRDGVDGIDGYSVLLSDEFVEVPVDDSRKPTSSVSRSCKVNVYKGLTALTPTTEELTVSRFKVTAGSVPSGISVSQPTPGTIALSVGTGSVLPDVSEIPLTITVSNAPDSLIPVRNLVTDGSFENVAANWITWSTNPTDTAQAKHGTQSLKLGGDALAQANIEKPIVGHKYYGREWLKTNGNLTAADCRFEIISADPAVNETHIFGWNQGDHPGWTIISDVLTITSANASAYHIRTFTVGGSVDAWVDGLMIVDLTATFGAGNEPDKAWCDANIPFETSNTTLPAKITIRANTNELASAGYKKTVQIDGGMSKIYDYNTGEFKLKLYAESSTEEIFGEQDAGTKDTRIYVGDDTTAVYDFSAKDTNGYYISTNAGSHYSCSYMRLNFNFSQPTAVTFRCVCLGETRYDYGLISAVDCDLTVNYKPDDDGGVVNPNVYYSFRSNSAHTDTPVDVVMTVPAGSHYVTIKYCKDSGTNAAGDYFKFRAFTTQRLSTNSKSHIALKAGKEGSQIELAATDIVFQGLVTFESLSTPGATVIDGANVKTDNLHVENVFLGGDNSRKIITSSIGNSGGVVDIGFIQNYGSSSYGKVVKIYADYLYIVPPGGHETDDNVLVISTKSMYFGANSSNWNFDI